MNRNLIKYFSSSDAIKNVVDYIVITVATIILAVGIYIFKYPNHFSFGGVSGFSILLAAIGHYTAVQYALFINFFLLLLGFIFLGKAFGIKTIYVTLLQSVLLNMLEKYYPMSAPLTDQPVLELLFAILLPAISSALLFNIGASSGGTDIIAMIVKKHSNINIGTALLYTDIGVAIASWFIFGPTTGLFSITGLAAKSLVVDNVIESLNLCKYFTIICEDPDPICNFIIHKLNRSATVYNAEGAYSGQKKHIILTIMKRSQAVELRNFIYNNCPGTFIAITNSSEIIGKGFRGFN